MKSLLWIAPYVIQLHESDDPQPGADERLVDVVATGICGSDVHGYRGHSRKRIPPLVLGHEATVRDEEGQLYAVFPLIPCDRCEQCRSGQSNLCLHRSLLGMDRQGTFAERMSVPERNLVPLPSNLDHITGTLVEPLALTMQVLRKEMVGVDTRLLVIGCGPIGLLAIYAFSLAGALVSAVDPVASRRVVAESLGARDVAESYGELGDAGSFDLVFDAVGVAASWAASLSAVQDGGTIALVGLGQEEGTVALGQIVPRGITLRGYYAYTRDDFEASLSLLSSNPPPTDWLHIASLQEGPDVFTRLDRDPGWAAKVIFLVTPPA